MKTCPWLALAFCGWLAAHFALPAAIRLGSVWDSQARPLPADVALAGKTYTGALSQTWDGALQLREGDRTLVQFRPEEDATVTYHPAPGSLSLAASWRRFAPFALVAALALLCTVPVLVRLLRRLRGGAASP